MILILVFLSNVTIVYYMTKIVPNLFDTFPKKQSDIPVYVLILLMTLVIGGSTKAVFSLSSDFTSFKKYKSSIIIYSPFNKTDILIEEIDKICFSKKSLSSSSMSIYTNNGNSYSSCPFESKICNQLKDFISNFINITGADSKC